MEVFGTRFRGPRFEDWFTQLELYTAHAKELPYLSSCCSGQ